MDNPEDVRKEKEFHPAIRRARISTLIIYEISDSELDTIARGSPASIYLNLAIFLLTVFISFLITLLTTPPSPNRMFTVFLVIAAISFVGGFTLLCLWVHRYRSTTKMIDTIKNRLPPEGVPEIMTEEDDNKK